MLMGNRIILSCEEIYSRVIKLNNSMGYHYYTVPFKEKVFFLPLRGFYDEWIKGNVREIILVPDVINPNKMIMMDFKTYPKKGNNYEKSIWDDFD